MSFGTAATARFFTLEVAAAELLHAEEGKCRLGHIKISVMIFLCAIFLIAAFAPGASVAHDESGDRPRFATKDKIRILTFDPSGSVRPGVETKFTIEIEVDLQSAKEGVARVGFNLDSPTSFRMIDSRDVHAGIQKIKFSVKTKPVDWGNRGYFAAIINLGPKTTESQWTPMALAHKAISVKR
jgi:hypothetical protein